MVREGRLMSGSDIGEVRAPSHPRHMVKVGADTGKSSSNRTVIGLLRGLHLGYGRHDGAHVEGLRGGSFGHLTLRNAVVGPRTSRNAWNALRMGGLRDSPWDVMGRGNPPMVFTVSGEVPDEVGPYKTVRSPPHKPDAVFLLIIAQKFHLLQTRTIQSVGLTNTRHVSFQASQVIVQLEAVANSTSATFLRVVGSELIQKYLGDGPKLVRELFRVADDLSPSIVFIDEIDAVGTKRYDAHSGGEREIQRTMLELLNQLDGFDSRGDVKVILATNKIESLDPALLRPGRIDRKIEFPLPDIKTRRRIFTIHTSRMTLADDVNLEEFVMTKDEFSGADIKAICTEAGLLALRERRMKVTHADFKKAKDKVMFKKKEGVPEGLYM
ncbi:hypothetical protein BVRB_7g167410 [Beta vulgaris subsp. vulgaris]|nr:hypothetical protein BVRB_7g167410 [Beta vulgaris subsp. vulgaris]